MKKNRIASILLAAVTILTSAFTVSAAKEEKVLFEDDFDTLSSEYRILDGNASRVKAEGGFLYIDATGLDSVRVLLPKSLDSYGNYRIEVKATLLSPSDQSRWNSIMYRVQKEDYPYYQMAIRSDATLENGVEFAERTTANSWAVSAKASFSEKISENKMYTYTVNVSGHSTVHSINGEDCVESQSLNSYKTGAIGFQANKSIMKIDSVKVTELAETETKEPDCVQIAQPATNIIGGITLSRPVTSKAILDEISSASVKPANAIFEINASGKAVGADGTEFATLDEIFTALNRVIMPTFKVSSEDAAQALCKYLKDEQKTDYFVMSENKDLVKTMRSTVTISRGVLDLSSSLADKKELSEAELLDIRGQTNSCKASVVVLPSHLATQKNVKYIYDRLVTVWVKDDNVSNAAQAYRLAVSGAHGIISNNEKLIIDTIKNYLSEKALTRIPLNIGHRGLPTKAPENTIKGAQLAYENGADVIEIDVYLTTDNEVVVMHDPTTGRTCDKNLTVENCTLAQLKELKANKGFTSNKDFTDCTIPTLEEFYKEFKDKDIMIFCEIKSAKTQMIDKFKELTEKYDMADQVSVITFNQNQISRLKKLYPEMSAGYLMLGIASGSNGAEMALTVLNTIQKYGSTYNPSYNGHTKDYIVNANMRSVMTWPWTIDDRNTYVDYFTSGFNGITTNNCSLVKSFPKSITTDATEYAVENKGTHTINATLTTYDRDTKDAFASSRNGKCEIIVLDGKENATLNGHTFTFVNDDSTLTYALKYTYSNTYSIYSEPVVLKSGKAAETEPVTDNESQAPIDSTSDTAVANAGGGNTTVIVVCVIGAVLVCAIVVGTLVILKKKKSDK